MKTSFKTYLQRKNYSSTSIDTYEREVDKFLKWSENENMQIDLMRYSDIVAYMDKCKGYSRKTVQHIIITLGHYFDYLVESGVTLNNPAKGIKVMGVKRRTLYRILESEELDSIYQNFQASTLSQKRNKVIVGLFVFQGLKTEELYQLEVRHIKLNEGKIQIVGSRKGNGRTLTLEPAQIMHMNTYIKETRNQIIEKSGEKTDRLLVNLERGFKLRVDVVIKELKTQNPRVEKADQLRASVIVKWLKMYNLRQVQYLAGHRFISSTEAYLQSEMDGLSEEVNKFHPLG